MYFSSVYFCCHSFHKLLHYMYLCAAIQQFCFLDLSKAFSFLFCFYSLLIRTVRICVLHTFSLIFIKYHTNCAHHSNQILFYIFYSLFVCLCFFLSPSLFLLYPPFLFSQNCLSNMFLFVFFFKEKKDNMQLYLFLFFFFFLLFDLMCVLALYFDMVTQRKKEESKWKIFFFSQKKCLFSR